MLKFQKADLLELFVAGEFDVIGHGCNCQNTMESGIARQIKDKWPGVYEIDCETIKGDCTKLGNFTYYDIKEPNPKGGFGRIYNLYTQYNYGRGFLQVNYAALELCMRKMMFLNKKKKIGIPKIGCGLGGGNWEKVENILKEILLTVNCNLTVCYIEE